MKSPIQALLIYSTATISVLMMACAGDAPTVPLAAGRAATRSIAVSDGKVAVCHMGDPIEIIEVSTNALAAHLRHGDHIAEFAVDRTSGDIGDGIHFGRISDAIATARAIRVARGEEESAACRITIDVAPGPYTGSSTANADPSIEQFPLVIDVPDVTLKGALQMGIDAGGRATGVGETEDVSTLAPTSPLISLAQLSAPIVVVNGHPNGFHGNGAIIEGFAFQSGHSGLDGVYGGLAIFSLRVSGLEINGNRFESGFSESVDLRATSATLNHNHLSGGGVTCDFCLAGPGDYSVEGNRLLSGGIPGILITPATLIPVVPAVEQYVLPAAATVTATVVNNEVRNHLRKPVGVGLRVGAIGVGAPNVSGTSRVDARDNLLSGNNFAVIVEAAFPVANTLRRGDISLSLHGNTLESSCQNHVLVSLSRHTTGLGLASAPYLLNSTYSLSLGGDIAWENVWYSHPAGFGNTLIVDGVEIPNGSHNAYDAARSCSPS